ncbi:MAG: accessory Sec system glycosylation chaperone GtfB [Eubacterium sp.]|nr:accessory Sec system glycosylation chaperone GtfB [Eubacterium sp.]
MEKYHGMTDGVLLLNNYGEYSQMLHQSFRRGGFTGPVIVIEDDGFFPEDVISLYQYFCGDFQKNGKKPGKARYFNQIDIPDYWEITGSNSGGKVHNLHRERGRIFYAEPKHKRLVRVVDWLDEKGIVRSSDHYNRYGVLYARTFFNKDAKRFCKAYFDPEGRETILENFVTHDIILNRDGRVYVYKGRVDLILKLLEELRAMESRIFFNSLSTPLFVSERMPAGRRGDVLFWQEGVRNDIPGNMQMILKGNSRRVQMIYVQNRDSYNKLIELGASKETLKPLGFAYAYTRQNTFANKALICTNSDRIEKCKELIQALPQMHFHIAAITEMSSKLMSLSQYPNVTLHPAARMSIIEELFDACNYYLDINHETEIVSAVKQAFLHEQLIVGFSQTLHNRAFIAPEHIFNNLEGMIAFFNKVMNHKEMILEQIDLQKKTAMSEEATVYTDLLK